MKEILEKLPSTTFIRVYRSYIVNLDHIVWIGRTELMLLNGLLLPIGEAFSSSLTASIAHRKL